MTVFKKCLNYNYMQLLKEMYLKYNNNNYNYPNSGNVVTMLTSFWNSNMVYMYIANFLQE